MQPASVAHQSRACKPLQYPQTGRTSCNFFLSLFTFPATCLQYPQTGRTSFNIAADLRCIGARDLAVPSDGSNLMQLKVFVNATTPPGDLQYPQTGRTSCNNGDLALNNDDLVLAVPSDGSNLMQQGHQITKLLFLRSCSTLRRVEPNATYTTRSPSLTSEVLQYPQTGRT